MYLSTFDDKPTSEEYKEIAAKTGLTTWQIQGIVGNARSRPGIYKQLIAQGFAEEQIPGWFVRQARPQTPRESDVPPGQTTSLELPAPRDGQASPQEGQVPPGGSHEEDGVHVSIEQGGPETGLGVPGSRLALAGGGAPQGGYTAEQVAYLRGQGIVQLADGVWVRPIPDGGGGPSQFEPVDPRLFLPGAVPYGGDTGKMISEQMIREMDAHVHPFPEGGGLKMNPFPLREGLIVSVSPSQREKLVHPCSDSIESRSHPSSK